MIACVTGWIADFFRFAWGLIYWNARKTWFRLGSRGMRAPCQHPSDSGRAMETHCEACVHWHRPARFSRVCPLLVATPNGLRCSAHSVDVRPFWGRALGYYGGSALGVYLAVALGVFVFLRAVGYPISIVHVTWPGLWYRVPQARGAFFFEKGNRAMQAGRIREALLNFDNAYRFDPSNYAAGLVLARNYQTAQPAISDALFARLYHEHAPQRAATAQDWFRGLLARGAFEPIADLATRQILADTAASNPWMRALIFSTRQTRDTKPLQTMLEQTTPAARLWHPLLRAELQLRAQPAVVPAALLNPWPDPVPAYAHYFQVEALVARGKTFEALDLLGRLVGKLDDESALALRLDAFAQAGMTARLAEQFDALLRRPPSLALFKILSVHLIRYPDRDLTTRLAERFDRAALPLDTENAGAYFSLLCVVGANGDRARLAALAARLKTITSTPFLALNSVEAFFNHREDARRIASILPALPLPAEMTYALLERFPGPPPVASRGGSNP